MHKVFRGRRRKIIAAGISAGLVLSMGGAAWAAWALEATGSTTSTETTGATGSAPVTVVAGNLTDALTPGGPGGNIPITVTNPSATNSVQVSAVVVTVTGTSAGAACPASAFTIYAQPVFSAGPMPLIIPPSGSVTTAGGTLANIGMNPSAPLGCSGGVVISISEVAS
jgi:hypothetical protein